MPNIPQIKIGSTTYDLHDTRMDDLKSDLGDNRTVIIPSEWTDNVYVDRDGSLPTNNGACASEYINIEGCSSVTVITTGTAGMYICAFDSSHHVVRYVRINVGGHDPIAYVLDTTGCKYVRLSSRILSRQYAKVIPNVQESFSTLEEQIKNVKDINIEIPLTWTDNAYVDNDGSLPTYNGCAASDFIDVSGLETVYVITYMKAGMKIVCFDINHNPVRYIAENTNPYEKRQYEVDASGCAYIRFACAMSNKDECQCWANSVASLKAIGKRLYSKYGGDIDVTLGNGYSTLKAALEYAETVASVNNHVNIYVPAGEWNAFAGYDLPNESANFKGPIVPDYVNIIGIGCPDNVIIKAELPADMTGYAYSRNNVSTLNLWRNNDLKNVKVISKNMRYPVHNDKATTDEKGNYVQHFENCYFLANGEDGVTADNISFGSGMAKGARLHFKNCIFDSPMNPYMCANFHNRVNGQSAVIWTFEHCQFIGGRYGMLLTSYNSGQTDVLNFIGCKMEKNIIFQTQLESRQCDYKLFGCGNSIPGYTWNGATEKPSAIEMMLN